MMKRTMLIGAAALLLAAICLPLWGMTLVSVQYPEGLRMVVYPTHIRGDITEINLLNHYIGMAEISNDFFVELKVIPVLFGLIAGTCLIAAVVRRTWVTMLPVILMAMTAVYGFWSMRSRLYSYGHELDPAAAIDIEPFTPPMLGENTIAQFGTYAYFSWGTFLPVVAGLLVSIVLWLDLKHSDTGDRPMKRSGSVGTGKRNRYKGETEGTGIRSTYRDGNVQHISGPFHAKALRYRFRFPVPGHWLVAIVAAAMTACSVERTPDTRDATSTAEKAAAAELTAGDREYDRITANWSSEALELCGRGLRDALGTRDLVQGALDGVNDSNNRAAAEIEDARHWLAQGDARLNEIRPALEAGTCDSQVTTALDEVWQFYVKAGTAAVQAGQIAGS